MIKICNLLISFFSNLTYNFAIFSKWFYDCQFLL